jgi:hypothetical protein
MLPSPKLHAIGEKLGQFFHGKGIIVILPELEILQGRQEAILLFG